MTLSLQIFDTPSFGTLLADFTTKLHPPGGGLRLATNRHGFAALEAPFIPLPLKEAVMIYDWPKTPHMVVSDRATGVAWEGRLEDTAIVPGGIRLGGLGYWMATRDAPYIALWSDPSVNRWRIATADDISSVNPEIWRVDKNNRLYMTPQKDKTFSTAAEAGGLTYAVPHNGDRDLVEVTFDYSFTAPTNWKAQLNSYTDAWGGAVNEWSLTGNGANQSGSATVTTSSGKQRLLMHMFNNTGSAVTTTADDGVDFLKITNIRVKTQASSIFASDIAAALVTYINGINSSQIQNDSALIEATTDDLTDELYEDEWPAAILDRLALLHNYEVGIWEERRLHFRAKGSQGRDWYVDVTNILNLERSLEPMRNSAYAIYQDANGRTLRTAVTNDAASQARYGITRRGVVRVQTTSQTQAEAHRDAFLTDRADFALRADIEFDRLYDAGGAELPIHVIRSGDSLTMRNLPPTLSADIDNIRSFRIGETEYSAVEDEMSVAPEVGIPTLVRLVARQAAGMRDMMPGQVVPGQAFG